MNSAMLPPTCMNPIADQNNKLIDKGDKNAKANSYECQVDKEDRPRVRADNNQYKADELKPEEYRVCSLPVKY
jgi:hypothetical protein